MPKVRPRIMLPLSVCLWGAMVSLMATVKTHTGLFGLRICLGFAEAVSNQPGDRPYIQF